jgi:hypothetical protein
MSSAFVEIDLETITKVTQPHEAPLQAGPVRFFDKEMRCRVSGYYQANGEFVPVPRKPCNSPTYIRVLGKPTCTMHAVRELNRLMIEMGHDGS